MNRAGILCTNSSLQFIADISLYVGAGSAWRGFRIRPLGVLCASASVIVMERTSHVTWLMSLNGCELLPAEALSHLR